MARVSSIRLYCGTTDGEGCPLRPLSERPWLMRWNKHMCDTVRVHHRASRPSTADKLTQCEQSE